MIAAVMTHTRRFPWSACLLMVLSALPSWAQTRARVAGTPGLPAIRALRDIAYVSNGTSQQKLDLYIPNNPPGMHPLVVWVHGGGWTEGSKADCPARWLVSRGYVVASIDYRLSQVAKFPAQIEDCKSAIRWLRAHAAEYGIDPKEVGVWGASAGGHLVALLGTTGNDHRFDKGENLAQSSAVACVVDWFGPTDFLHYGDPVWTQLDRPDSLIAQLLGGTVSANPDKAKSASPIYYVSANSAPFLIEQGDHDNLVPLQQSRRLSEALQKAGVECTLKIIPGAGHGGKDFMAISNIAQIAAFFSSHLQTTSALGGKREERVVPQPGE